MSRSLHDRLAKVRLLFLDNDGVLTDGRIVLGDYGDELKFFDVQDGFGLALARRFGIRSVIVSGKKCRVNPRRAKELGIERLFQGVTDKLDVFEKITRRWRIQPEEVCCIGDDWLDLAPMRRAGVAVAVANAVPEVRSAAQWVTTRPGGRGAVREVVDAVLKARGLYAEALRQYDR